MRRLSHFQIIALGFLIMILIGTMLLLLPISTRSGESPSVLTALFTATSASCVTGLVLVDTSTFWSVFGQLVILCLIQIGGLGFMTIAIVFLSFARNNLGLRKRAIMAESINTTHIAGLKKLTRKIITGTIIVELTGAALLSIRFIREFGLFKGLYFSVFHSVSAFCNAGFDLMGFKAQYSSFTDYYDDALVNLTIMSLIIIGGIGFLVWNDIQKNSFHFKRYQLHSKIVLVTTAILIVSGALIFYFSEYDGVLNGMSLKGKILSSFFNSVTARTAGFNTTDNAALSGAGKLSTIVLMFIGGSSGSTAGGIKTTTIAVVFIYLFAGMRSQQKPHVFKRTIEDGSIRKATSVLFFNFLLAFTVAIVMCLIQDIPVIDILFEAFSAIGTVGMSTGITRDLLPVSRVLIIFLMYCGRVGSISFAIALLEKRAAPPVSYPVENITIG